MKLKTFSAHLVTLLKMPMSEFTELERALKEQSDHFKPGNDYDEKVVAWAVERGIGHKPQLLKGKAGPGGGVELDAFRAAFFLLAVVLNGPRKESAYNTWMTWHLNQEGSILGGAGDDFEPTFTVCPLTGQHLFGEALKAIIEDEGLARRVDEIRVSSNLSAEIHYGGGKVSRFEKGYRDMHPTLYRVAVLNGLVLVAVSQLVRMEG